MPAFGYIPVVTSKSVPRAVASGYLEKTRSLPLAVLTKTRKLCMPHNLFNTFQEFDLGSGSERVS